MGIGQWDNNYFKKFANNKEAGIFLPDVTSEHTRFDKHLKEEIMSMSNVFYSYIDQFIKVSKTSLSTLFGTRITTDYRLKELIALAIWIHTDSSILYSLGSTKELVDNVFDDYVKPWACDDDARCIKYFLDTFTTFGFFSLDDSDLSFLRVGIYNCVTTAFIFEKSLLTSYVELISQPGRVTDVSMFQEVVLSSYAARPNLLYTANSAFFSQVEPNLLEILQSLTKEVELV